MKAGDLEPRCKRSKHQKVMSPEEKNGRFGEWFNWVSKELPNASYDEQAERARRAVHAVEQGYSPQQAAEKREMNIPRFTAGASIYKSTMPLNSARSNFAIRSHGRRRCFLFIPLALACLALSQTALAAIDPNEGDRGNGNTSEGFGALSNTTGSYNTATGALALVYNTTGSYNTATGAWALLFNTTGSDNAATGALALFSNTTGGDNTATGARALVYNTTGSGNAATGSQALFSNTTGDDNTAIGWQALYSNTTGSANTAIGSTALYSNTTGYANTAVGAGALYYNTTGGDNIALGVLAGLGNVYGEYNIYIGSNALTSTENYTIRIGAQQYSTFIAGIYGSKIAGVVGIPVVVNSSGQLGTVASSERFKDEIKPMDTASEAILALRPVTFRYKHEIDPTGIPQFGLVAEEVEKVNPDLVVRDAQGKVYSVRYEAVNAMLLNEFLKEHRTVEELKGTITKQETTIENQEATITQLKAAALKQEAVNAEQRKGIEALTASLEKQEAQIQKVSAQLEMSKPAPRTVDNDQ